MAFGGSLEEMLFSFMTTQEIGTHIRHVHRVLNPKRNPVIDGHVPVPFFIERHEVKPCRGGFAVELDGWYQTNADGRLVVQAKGATTSLHNALGAAYAPVHDVCFDFFRIDATVQAGRSEQEIFCRMGSIEPRFTNGTYIHEFCLCDEDFEARVRQFRYAFVQHLAMGEYDKLESIYRGNTYLDDRKKSDFYYHIAHTLRAKVMLCNLFRSKTEALDKRLYDASELSCFLLEELSKMISTRCEQEQRLEKIALHVDPAIDVNVWPFLNLDRRTETPDIRRTRPTAQEAAHEGNIDNESIDLWPYERVREFRKRLFAKPVVDLKEGKLIFESIATRKLERDAHARVAVPYQGEDVTMLAQHYYYQLYERINAVTLGVHVRVPFDIVRSESVGAIVQFFIRFPKQLFGHSQENAQVMLDFYRFLAEYTGSIQDEDIVAADRPLAQLQSYLRIADDGTYPWMPREYAQLLDAIDVKKLFGRTFVEQESKDHIDFVFNSPASCARAVCHILLRDDLATQYVYMNIFGR